ncbi:hypothetical protein [[Actinomadura] parvosata]|uniref:hypothetical protein n=1 Tax=[Actinomadura] parvosata TaxID=1955412 RepID=UPI0012BC818A|nr:hypothetical protein [Nonomuraea sp. ATCC 55076]
MIDKPPGWCYHAAVVLTTLVLFWWVSIPVSYSESGVLVIFVLVPLVLYWVVRFLVALIRDARAVWRRLPGWILLPLIVAGLWAAVDADLPFKARFALSRSSMEDFARSILTSGAREDSVCAWTGLYPVCGHLSAETESSTVVRLHISDWPITGSRGFIWAPYGPPPLDDYDYDLRHVTGPWWGCRGWDGW